MKKQLLALLIILGTALLPAAAHSASFDCKKAATWIEKRVCANTELSKLDNAMAEKYKRDLANTSDYEDSEIFKGNMIIDQRLWLRFQRNTCTDTECLIREYKEYIEDKNYNGVAWDFADELNRSNSPNNNSFGEFSQDVEVPMYNSETNDWKVIAKTTNSVSIHRVANKPYLAIIEGVLVFTNGHTCEIEASKATWSQNHWVINDDRQNKTTELRLYPAFYKGKTQLLLKDMDNQYREVHCGMRGYFDGIVLERE